jgi:hypothetical protein
MVVEKHGNELEVLWRITYAKFKNCTQKGMVRAKEAERPTKQVLGDSYPYRLPTTLRISPAPHLVNWH